MESESVTYICFIQDHSGSMNENNKAELAKDNFNEQRAKLLKEDDETMDSIVTIVEFDDTIHCNIDGVPISDIDKMKNWWTGGMTALYDAIGYGIYLIEKKFNNDDREDKAVLFIVQTDGYENASETYGGEEGRLKLKSRISELEKTKIWTFTFLGENIDEKVATSVGFKTGNIMKHTERNVAQAYACSTQGIGDFMKLRKAGSTQTMSFYDKKVENDNNSK